MSAVTAPPRTGWARQVLREAEDAAAGSLPPQAATSVRMSAACLAGELDVHGRLASGALGWAEFGPDLETGQDDPGEAAVTAAADRVDEAAKALVSLLREHQGREARKSVLDAEGVTA